MRRSGRGAYLHLQSTQVNQLQFSLHLLSADQTNNQCCLDHMIKLSRNEPKIKSSNLSFFFSFTIIGTFPFTDTVNPMFAAR